MNKFLRKFFDYQSSRMEMSVLAQVELQALDEDEREESGAELDVWNNTWKKANWIVVGTLVAISLVETLTGWWQLGITHQFIFIGYMLSLSFRCPYVTKNYQLIEKIIADRDRKEKKPVKEPKATFKPVAQGGAA